MRSCAGTGIATRASRLPHPDACRFPIRAATPYTLRLLPPRLRRRRVNDAQQERGRILRAPRRRAPAPTARSGAAGRGSERAQDALHEVPQVRVRSHHARMGRHSDRSVHALPRCLVRRRRGQGVDEEVGAKYPGARVSRCREGRDADVTDPQITPELVQEHNLTPDEYARIVAMLGRTPTFPELGIFSALWSEHCSYKHSRPILKTFPTRGPQVVQGPGENAGVLRLPGGWAVAFKIESHNHPSAVEPYQGAATGAGGILRDVFTMGARPVALLNSLRFGSLEEARNRYLCAGVVRGVGDYGNCVGVPTLGGEVDFGPGYGGNPLVNAMCVGLLKERDLITAAAHGVGNVLLVVGSRTGRDGIHGASFASEELTHASERRRPQVQVGDPFTEKLLLEASLELIASSHIVAIQDMGAAGLTSSSAEMAAKGGVGVEIDLSRVPTREPGMTPYEILLSESQERMLVVAKADRVKDVQATA